MIYFDNAATSFPKPPGMAEAIMEHMAAWCGNPGRSGHELSRRTEAAVSETRELLAEFIGAGDPSRIIFTSNATAALNLAIHGILQEGDHVITTSMEHNSVLRPVISSGAEYTIIPCKSDGSLDLSHVKSAIRENTRMIVCTHASNVTGTIMPVQELVQICRMYNLKRPESRRILLLVDASQTLGHIPVSVAGGARDVLDQPFSAGGVGASFSASGVDLLAGPGHKGLLGPMGTGFLYVKPGVELRPMMQGGTGTYSKLLEPPLEFPESFEAGTVNAPGLVGLGYVLKWHMAQGRPMMTASGKRSVQSHVTGDYDDIPFRLTRVLDESLRNMRGIKVYGPVNCKEKVSIVTFNIDGWDSRDVGSLLNDNFGIATRAGFHCAGLAHKTIGTWDTGAVRMSLGVFNNMRQIRLAVDAVYRISKLAPGSRLPVPGPGCRRP